LLSSEDRCHRDILAAAMSTMGSRHKVAKGKAHVKAKVHVKVIEVQKRDKDSREKGMVKDTKCQVKDMVGQACQPTLMIPAATEAAATDERCTKADAVSFNMILGAYSRNGDVTQLKALFDCMHRRGVRPNAHTLSVVVNALAKSDDAECVGYSIGTAVLPLRIEGVLQER